MSNQHQAHPGTLSVWAGEQKYWQGSTQVPVVLVTAVIPSGF